MRFRLGKTTVSTNLLRACEAGIDCWPLPAKYGDDDELERTLFRRMGRPACDTGEPDWQYVSREFNRKGVTLALLWQEYREVHAAGYGYTWFCERFQAHETRSNPVYRHRHDAGAAMQIDYARHTIPVVDAETGEVHQSQLFVVILGASNYTFVMASMTQQLPDWVEGQVQAYRFCQVSLSPSQPMPMQRSMVE